MITIYALAICVHLNPNIKFAPGGVSFELEPGRWCSINGLTETHYDAKFSNPYFKTSEECEAYRASLKFEVPTDTVCLHKDVPAWSSD